MVRKRDTERGMVLTDKPEPLVYTKLLGRIVKVLLKHKERGLWIRKLAREANISTRTASRYVHEVLRDYVTIQPMEKPFKVTMVRLIEVPEYDA